jgi:hypothetical protein
MPSELMDLIEKLAPSDDAEELRQLIPHLTNFSNQRESRRDDLTKQTRKDHPAPSLRSSAVPAKRLSYGSTFTLIFR